MTDWSTIYNELLAETEDNPGETGTAADLYGLTSALGLLDERPPATRVRTVDGAEGAPFRITIDAPDKVFYAMAHNRVPVIRSFAISLAGGAEASSLMVDVELKWSREDRPPAKPVSFVIEALGDSVQISDVGLKLDDSVLVDLEEAVPASFVVRVQSDGGHEQIQTGETRILARNEWAFDRRYGELLAAFVQPNHPSVNDILARAGDLLRSRTGSSSLEGYQSGPARAVEIGHAIFDALKERDIRYINPPASFESAQKIRPIDQVLAEQQGTCIDLACAYAACLEQAGLHPLIWLVPGHAFAGFWTEDEALPSSFVTDAAMNLNLIESGLVVSVETVGLTDASDFSTARNLTVQRHSAQDGSLDGVIDVHRAHRMGMLPIPARVQRGDVIEIIIDRGPSRGTIVDRRDRSSGKRIEEARPPRIQAWESGLLDLSLRNQLINFRTGRSGIDLLATDAILSDVEDDLNAGRQVLILPGDRIEGAEAAAGLRDISRAASETLERLYSAQHALYAPMGEDVTARRIRTLVSKARLTESETGSNNLFLVLGTMIWTPAGGSKEVRSPLFLLPVRLRRPRGAAVGIIEMDESGFTTPNYSLVEKLRIEFGLDIPELESPPEDASGIDMSAALQAVRRAVIDRALPVRIDGTAHLATLEFSKFRLWKDLRDHWKVFMENALVRHLVENPGGIFEDSRSDEATAEAAKAAELETWCPIPADGTQLRAIQRAASGDSFVIEGPPGTGKSQTITNLLANALGLGKSVLFVAEKQAALTVVKERLQAIGLDPYCLDLHDKGSKPEEIRAQLATALDHQPEADTATFDQLNRNLAGIHRRLDEYRRAVYERNALGMSYRWAHEESLRIGEGPEARIPIALANFSPEAAAALDQEVQGIEPLVLSAKPSLQHPWRLSELEDYSSLDRARLSSDVRDVADAVALVGHDLPESLRVLLSHVGTSEDLHSVIVLLQEAAKSQRPSRDVILAATASGWIRGLEETGQTVGVAVDQVQTFVRKYGDRPLLMPLDAFERAVSGLSLASGSFIVGRRSRIERAVVELLGHVPTNKWDRQSAATLANTARSVRSAMQGARDRLQAAASPLEIPVAAVHSGPSLSEFIARARTIAALARILSRPDSLGLAAKELWNHDANNLPNWIADVLIRLDRALVAVFEAVKANPQEVARWVGSRSLLEAVRTAVPEWVQDATENRFLRLQRWCTLISGTRVLRENGLDDLRLQILDGVLPPDEVGAAFHRGVVRMSLEERAVALQLDEFDRFAHDGVIRRFVDEMNARREALTSVIPHRLNQGRTFDPAVPFGAVAELRAELRRRRGARSVRELIAKHGQLIQGLTPCFLMSPDSVAKFLPAGSLTFDIVVFDEASQIEVADAIGAMGRARSVIIVGDSKQMPPTRFGGSSEEDVFAGQDETVTVVDDAESLLLEAVDAGMDREWLSWHYRSQDESLIAFSNHHYYEGRLSSFPSPKSLSGAALSWRNVQGQFEHGDRRINAQEAAEVVREVIARLDDPSRARESIGVVTLNSEQQGEILSRLEKSGHPLVLEQLERDGSADLFVRNLENVQGHERDVIIFSTAFSKMRDGRPMPLNFGPLNRAGGERRLNVAVTRARKEMVVISSFEPEEIDPSRAKALGLLHLREFLVAAKRGFAEGGEAPVGALSDRHRADVRRSLEQRGLTVGEDVGMSPFRIDLAVSIPGDPAWRVAVLLDGARWRDRATVGDRDGLPAQVLKRLMGWTHVVRIWLPSWRAEKEALLDEIEHLVRSDPPPRAAHPPAEAQSHPAVASMPSVAAPFEKVASDGEQRTASDLMAKSAQRGAHRTGDFGEATPPVEIARPVPVATPVPKASEPDSIVQALRKAGAEEFRAFEGGRPMGPSDQCAPGANPQPVRSTIRMVLESEGPIEINRLAGFVGGMFDLGRLRGPRRDFIVSCIPPHWRESDERGEFVWPEAIDRGAWTQVRLPSPDASSRSIAEIPTRELVNAFLMVTRLAGQIPKDELLQVTANAFGVKRLTQGIRASLTSALRIGLKDGVLREVIGGAVEAGAPLSG